jgi:stage V sporulation protein G
MSTVVTEIQIIPIKPKDGLVAFANVVVDGKFFLGSIGVHTRLDGTGYRLTFPTKRVGERNMHVYHPINRESAEAIENAIATKMEEVIIHDFYASN